MQRDAYQNGWKVGLKLLVGFKCFCNLRKRMLAYAGTSKPLRNIANALFFSIVTATIILTALMLYYFIGILGSIFVVIIALALPKGKVQFQNEEDGRYDFNDGYRDGPEGYGYYSGGYKTDD